MINDQVKGFGWFQKTENFKKFVILAREIFGLVVFRNAVRSGSGALGLLNGTFSENARH